MLKRMADVPIPGKRRRGRQKTRWKDSCNRDMKGGGRTEQDRVEEINIDPKLFRRPQMGKAHEVCADAPR